MTNGTDEGREYGWRRVSGYPLVVSIGLDRETALSSVNERLLSNWYWNLVSTTVILLALLFIGLLISQARRQQKDVITNRKRLTDLVAQTPGAVYQLIRHISGDYQITYISSGVTALLGLKPSEVKRQLQSIFKLIHPQDLPAVSEELERSAETLQRWDRVFRVCLDTGETRWLSVYAKPQRREDGSILWNGYLHDVTQAHHDTNALKSSEERLRITIDAVNDGLWEWDVASDSVHVDAHCLGMLGYHRPAETLAFAFWYAQIHPDDKDQLDRVIQNLSDGEMFGLQLRMRTASDSWLWVEIRGKKLDHLGEPLVIGTQSDISKRVAEEHLRNALLNNNAAAIVLISADNKIRLANDQAHALSPGKVSLAGKSIDELVGRDGQYHRFLELSAGLRRGKTKVETELPLTGNDDNVRWLSVQGTLLDPEYLEGDTIWTLMDISACRQMELELSSAQQRLTEVIRHFPSGVLLEGAHGEVVMINQALCHLLDLNENPDLINDALTKKIWKRLGLTQDVGPDSDSDERDKKKATETELPDGRTLQVETIPILIDGTGTDRLWILRDVTERRQREQTLEQLATTDALTGLPNRRAFLQHLENQALNITHSSASSMLMLDLDHFKTVNDTYGHATGDAALIHMADLLRSVLRQGDIAGRLGGEEFGVLLRDTDLDAAQIIAERLRNALASSTVRYGEHTFKLTTSIGLAPVTENATSVLARADGALYKAKHAGRNCVMRATS